MKLLWRFLLVASVPAWAQTSPTINDLPSREFGHAKLTSPVTSGAANLVEGREFNTPFAVVFSSSGVLYVADTSNHRVLAWRNSASLTKGNQADKVIGQRDFFSTSQQGGPGRDLSAGLTYPSGLAVDGSGNLYVLDAGNNRIVRYPNPFNQTSDPLSIDLVIGQKTQSSGSAPNEGLPQPSAKTLAFTSATRFPRAGIALDGQGNLWVADAGNNRVLRFPVSQLTANTIEPAANLVLGQPDFSSNTVASCGSTCQINGTILLQPQSLAFDSNGALYVSDGFARVLHYTDPQNGTSATKFLGVVPTPAPGQQLKPFPNEYSLGNSIQYAGLAVFTSGTTVFVSDTQAHRVVRYNSVANFSPTDTIPSPQIQSVIGQADLLSGKVNRGNPEPDAGTLSFPAGGAFDPAGNLWVTDAGNHRVLSYPSSGILSNASAIVVVGQTDFPFNAPNLIEGREVWVAASSGNQVIPGGGIVVDKNSDPPRLYIADTFNNRILGFKDARAVGTDVRSVLTQKADLVIGQAANDLFRSVVNWAPSGLSGDPDIPNRTGLLQPIGLAVDDSGDLWVADSGNGRVVRFPAPFSVAAGTTQSADLVLGQSDFNQKNLSASQQTMNTPFGLALFPGGHLAVSDSFHQRVLVFRKPAGGFTNGQSAFSVVGQQSFGSSGGSGSLAGLSTPRHIATDTSGRLYVCDSGNSRVTVYRDTSTISQIGPAAAFNFPFSQPVGITVSAVSSEMWVASGNTIYHLPEVTTYQNTSAILQQIPSNVPLAIALDSFENPIVAEAINRIAFYFGKFVVKNAFTFTSTHPLTPGMWVQGYPPNGKSLNVPDLLEAAPPYPKAMGGLQLLVNGVPSAISAIGKTFVNFNVPWSAPTTGRAEFLIFNPATGEIVGAGNFEMAAADPAIKTLNGLGTGQIFAINFTEGGLNGPQNPVNRGNVLQLALTGQGLVSNPPEDGVAPTSLTSTNASDLHVYINAKDVPAQNILFSGLDPTYPGSWIINVRIPDIAQGGPPPGSAVQIVVSMRDIFSNYGYDPSNFNNDIQLNIGNGRVTTFAVK